jgi:hypothetical protein
MQTVDAIMLEPHRYMTPLEESCSTLRKPFATKRRVLGVRTSKGAWSHEQVMRRFVDCTVEGGPIPTSETEEWAVVDTAIQLGSHVCEFVGSLLG